MLAAFLNVLQKHSASSHLRLWWGIWHKRQIRLAETNPNCPSAFIAALVSDHPVSWHISLEVHAEGSVLTGWVMQERMNHRGCLIRHRRWRDVCVNGTVVLQNMFLKQRLPASLYPLRHLDAEKIDVKELGKPCKSLASERTRKESMVLSKHCWRKWLAPALRCRMTLVQDSPQVPSWPKRKFVVLLVTNSAASLRHSRIMNQASEITRLRRKGEFFRNSMLLEISCFFQSLLYIMTYLQSFLPHPWGITDTLKNWDFHQITWLEELGLCGNHSLSKTLIIHSKGSATE